MSTTVTQTITSTTSGDPNLYPYGSGPMYTTVGAVNPGFGAGGGYYGGAGGAGGCYGGAGGVASYPYQTVTSVYPPYAGINVMPNVIPNSINHVAYDPNGLWGVRRVHLYCEDY